MLALVFSHGHQVCLVEQDVRRHEHRIGEETGGDVVGVLLGFLLKLGHAAELAELGAAAQHPTELCVLGDMALDKHDAFLGVQAAGNVLSQLF